jgi:hypothetical protein
MKTVYRIGAAGLAITLLSLSLAGAEGAQPGRRRARFAAPQRSTAKRANDFRNPNSLGSPDDFRNPNGFGTYSPYDVWMGGSSKYYGGFHARYFTEMLYPTGDRPVRGTAW